MANNVSNKFPNSKNIIYDSVNDTPTGKKRAVQATGGVSVAERARLFGTQVTSSSGSKNIKPPQPPIKPNIIPQERKYQSFKTDVDRNPKQESAYSSPPRARPVQINDKPKPEQSRNYSTVTRPSQNPPQRPIPSYDTFQYKPPPKPNPTTYLPRTTSGESYTSDGNPYLNSYEKQKSSSAIRNLNYFQPIQDPLEALYRESSQGYSHPQQQQQQQQQIPMSMNTNTSGVQPFDLGNLINRIQEDYLNNARPYVSSIQFIQSEQNLSNMGYITPSTNRKDYSRRNDDNYHQLGSSHYYDVIDPKHDLYPAYTRQVYNDNYSSMKRQKHRRRYHDQASSPIRIDESSHTMDKQYQPESPPATPKAPTPVEESSSEEEETTATKVESSSESEDESAPIPIGTPATQRNELPRPPLPNQTPVIPVRPPVKPVESESSESEESDSESESDTEEEQPKPSPAVARSNIRTIPQQTINNNSNNTNPPEPSSNSVDTSDRKSSAIGGKFKSIKHKFYRKKTS